MDESGNQQLGKTFGIKYSSLITNPDFKSNYVLMKESKKMDAQMSKADKMKA